jgi:ribosomal protein L7/L12
MLMNLVITGGGVRSVWNLDNTVKVEETDETNHPNAETPLFPFRISILMLDGTIEVVYQTDERFQCNTVMAGIVGALEEGKKTHTIDHPNNAATHSAVVTRAKGFYDGSNFIGTIKLVREMTGWGLKESKAFCDQYIKDPTLEDAAAQRRQMVQEQKEAAEIAAKQQQYQLGQTQQGWAGVDRPEAQRAQESYEKWLKARGEMPEGDV